MQILDKWERKFGWLSFPGFLRYYALFHVLVFILQFVNPNIGAILGFDRGKILSGEVWRMVTFLFADSGLKEPGGFAILFLFFMVMIAFMISDALEDAWGVFKTSMFYYAGFAGLLIGNFIYNEPTAGSGLYLYTAAFLAFATLFPKVEFLLLFVIPVQVRWFAILTGVFLALGVVSNPLSIGFIVLAFGNYLVWAGIPAMRGQIKNIESTKRNKQFKRDSSRDGEAFHTCAKCDRTELTDPELEFRMGADEKEYCEDHLES